MYYTFTDKTLFVKSKSLSDALDFSRGKESQVFKHVKGIPNPWFVHPVKNRKVDYDTVLSPSQLHELQKSFK